MRTSYRRTKDARALFDISVLRDAVNLLNGEDFDPAYFIAGKDITGEQGEIRLYTSTGDKIGVWRYTEAELNELRLEDIFDEIASEAEGML